ncbi:MAG: class D beta-lactamase [Pseudomonadota bacterium]
MTFRKLALSLVFGLFAAPLGADETALATEERADLEDIFETAGVAGAFALLDVAARRVFLVAPDRARQRMIPASTFKIVNSLIALELGVVADEEEIIPFGGAAQPIKAWEADMSLRDAMRVSNAPVFQEVARRVGVERYTEFLARINFGDGEVGEDVETFWLRGPLAISAVEQAAFLARLALGDLPVSARSQAIVRDIVRMEERGGAMLFGKTGWTTAPSPDLGWFVGWVERDDRVYAFALNMDIASPADAGARIPLARVFLERLGVY